MATSYPETGKLNIRTIYTPDGPILDDAGNAQGGMMVIEAESRDEGDVVLELFEKLVEHTLLQPTFVRDYPEVSLELDLSPRRAWAAPAPFGTRIDSTRSTTSGGGWSCSAISPGPPSRVRTPDTGSGSRAIACNY